MLGRRRVVKGAAVRGSATIGGMPLSSLIFDFDGTVVDTESAIFEVWGDAFRHHGFELTLAEWSQVLGTHGAFDPYLRLAELSAGDFGGDTARQEIAERVRQKCALQTLRPGVGALLEEAQRVGVRTAIASSSPLSWVEMWLDHHRIRGRFECVVCRDHVRQVKPAPDLFLRAAGELGVDSERSLVIEDSPNGALAAARAGMRCVVVPNRLTTSLTFPPVALRLDSLAGITLAELSERVESCSGAVQSAAAPARSAAVMESKAAPTRP